jgi:hypothetical protein
MAQASMTLSDIVTTAFFSVSLAADRDVAGAEVDAGDGSSATRF